jgi:leucyl aminopeptidase
MLPKIALQSGTTKKKNDLIVLFTDKNQLKTLDLLQGDTGVFIKKKLADEVKNFSLTHQGRTYFFSLLDKSKDHSGLEKARRKASDLHAFLKANVATNSLELLDLISTKEVVLSFIEGLILSNYSFKKHKTSDKDNFSISGIDVVSDAISKEELQELSILSEAVFKARDLVNEPHSHLTAPMLAKEAEKMGKEAGITVEIFNKAKIKSLKMGGLLAVNQGSVDEPRFIIMEYKPKKSVNTKPIVLVGKGVVYDTGGLSLKPTANSMDFMKADMGGAATVIAGIYAIAKAKLPLHVITLVPATDNRPGGNAYAPGDVVKMFNGRTVEVLNTDAEGRMILADALAYAQKYEPELVFDFATLTGAASAAIGPHGIVYMGDADKKIKDLIRKSGEEVCERLVEFPFWEDYDDQIKSDVADIKNIGGSYGGAITAGKFLAHFTDYPWLHFDIAGPAFVNKKMGYIPKGASGVGVRLLFQFAKNKTQ